MSTTITTREWLAPPVQLKLGKREVHLWCMPLEQSKSLLEQLYQTLSVEERKRAQNFRFEHDRQHFIVGRGVLRNILSQYLGIEPQSLQICYGAYGKPALVQLYGNDILTFNVSHSHDLALYAISVNREVGIDTEYMRPLADAMQIADTFFSRHERNTLRKVPEHLRLQAFFSCWTCKEAYVKAVGRGLSQTLDQFDVSFLPGEEAQLLSVDGQPEEVERWKLYTISLPPSFSHYKAALVAENREQNAELTGFWQWQEKGN